MLQVWSSYRVLLIGKEKIDWREKKIIITQSLSLATHSFGKLFPLCSKFTSLSPKNYSSILPWFFTELHEFITRADSIFAPLLRLDSFSCRTSRTVDQRYEIAFSPSSIFFFFFTVFEKWPKNVSFETLNNIFLLVFQIFESIRNVVARFARNVLKWDF